MPDGALAHVVRSAAASSARCYRPGARGLRRRQRDQGRRRVDATSGTDLFGHRLRSSPLRQGLLSHPLPALEEAGGTNHGPRYVLGPASGLSGQSDGGLVRRKSDDYCAPCLARWSDLPLEQRKRTAVRRAVTSVAGTRMCAPCAQERIEVPR